MNPSDRDPLSPPSPPSMVGGFSVPIAPPEVPAPPLADDAVASGEIEVVEMGTKALWRVAFYADRIRVYPPDGFVPVDAMRDREGVSGTFQVFDNLMMPRTLVLRRGKRNHIFRLPVEQFAVLREWVGPPSYAQLLAALKQRVGWAIPIGGFFLVIGLLSLAGRASGGLALEWSAVAVGVIMIAGGIGARVRPGAEWFLVDSLAFTVLTVDLVIRLLRHERGGGWWALVAFNVVIVLTGVGLFRKYRYVRAVGA
ncbi:MAG: hypothetical protein ACAI43_25825 [Phycisphaerae bacterium]|nr:hypothetical protein [Tepidisphaeraceae bacterium]